MPNDINYYALAPLLEDRTAEDWVETFIDEVVPAWEASYKEATATVPEILYVTIDGFQYAFDLTLQRAIGSFGITAGKHDGARDSSRMRGHPQSAGSDYHRGHLIAHTLGGGTDINLAGQLGRMNIGPFRKLERQAVKQPDSLYFVRLIYDRSNSGQLPNYFEQGLIADRKQPNIRVATFQN